MACFIESVLMALTNHLKSPLPLAIPAFCFLPSGSASQNHRQLGRVRAVEPEQQLVTQESSLSSLASLRAGSLVFFFSLFWVYTDSTKTPYFFLFKKEEEEEEEAR